MSGAMSLNAETDPSEVAVRARIEGLAQAIRDKDIDSLMGFYAPDVVVFDVFPPLDVRGADAYRKNFERWFSGVQGPIHYEMKNLRISISGHHANCNCLSHVSLMKRGGDHLDYWVRVTTELQNRSGQWLVTHEHISMPSRM